MSQVAEPIDQHYRGFIKMKTTNSITKQIAAMFIAFSLVSPLLAYGKTVDSGNKALTEDQKITHVLNRLGFGARPGDLERVKAIGLQKYIDQQLNPASIDDRVAEAKVNGLDVFNMSTAELFAKYPNPAALLKQLEGKAGAKKPSAASDANTNTKTDPAGQDPQKAQDDQTQAEQRERRQKIAALYQEYGLKPAGQIVPEIAANRILRAVYSERQLQEVMVDFWQNHFNVFSGKAAVRWYIPSYERDVLRKNALGNFRDLLVGTAEHPAMLFFLDNYESVSPNVNMPDNAAARRQQQVFRNNRRIQSPAQQLRRELYGIDNARLNPGMNQVGSLPKPTPQKRPQRGINENYARELMELHTLGVDGGYTQKDIIEVAKCFTGWTIADPRGYRRSAAGMIEGTEDRRLARLQKQQGVPDDVDSGEFYFNPRWHEGGPKTVLGQTINEGGVKDGLKVLDILVNSPATAHFIAKKLAVKFVSDTPSEGLVSRVADAFHNSRGDIKTTLKALFSDKEFFAPENFRAKIKTPFELAISSIRAIGANTTGGPQMLAMLNKMGEVPYGYQAPTGYPDMAEDWVNTGALLERMNFAIAVASNRIPGTSVDLSSFRGSDKAQILDKAVSTILNGEISSTTRSMLVKQLEQPLPEVKPGKDINDMASDEQPMRAKGQNAGRSNRQQGRLLAPTGDPDVFKAVSLVLGAPEFQRQ
jgi:uncharacterized protein (DUF1800 family)